MSTPKPSRLEGMSGAGLLVVSTLCICLGISVLTACGLAIASIWRPEVDVPDLLDRLVTALLASCGTLLAKTYVDKAKEPDPTTVTAPPTSTITVEPAEAAHADGPLEPADEDVPEQDPAAEPLPLVESSRGARIRRTRNTQPRT